MVGSHSVVTASFVNMSDDERERFEVTDYDLENEFNPNRFKRKLTKEQQYLGIWADSEDEYDNEYDGRRGKGKKPKDYSTPIDFVAGGVQQPGKRDDKDKGDSGDEGPVAVTSSEDEEKPEIPEERLTAGLRKRGMTGYQPQTLSSNMGNWEKHTKGIGAKLLLQMGYQPGKGLGKSLQGISAPIVATLRKGRGTIGAYGPEVKVKKSSEHGEEPKAIKDEEKKSYQWKKNAKQRYFYRDAEDVIQEGKPTQPVHTQQTAALAKTTVIDMRGPEKRVLSGYHALRAAAPRYEDISRKECSNLALPELLHNLNLLVDMCEQEIIDCSRESQTSEDRIVALERDKKALEDSIDQNDNSIEAMNNIIDEVEKLNRPDLSLDDAYSVFKKIHASYPTEYECLGLGSTVACGGCLRSLMGAALAAWLPLRTPRAPIALLEKWNLLLTPSAMQDVFWKPWLEQVQLASLEWDVREPNAMKAIVETWACVAPQSEIRTILRSAIVPRLSTAAMRWDPTVDTLPLHYWILPWHQYAGDLLEESVYPELRSRLVNALSAWHPADGSALALLRPWSQAWSLALPTLTRTHILPRLETCMRTIPVEPDSSATEPWGWCACWQEIIGARVLAGAAGRALLPRWLAALASWLNRRPPHAHLISHYSAWKNMFSEELLREPEFADTFRKALDMMNRSIDSPVQPPPPPPPKIGSLSNSIAIAEVMASSNQQKSFTELLESRCIERGLNFVPMVGRTREGRPLFKIGQRVQCYVLRNVAMYSNDMGRTFQPVSLEALLQIASI